MPAPRMLMILSENWTLTDGRSLGDLVTWARTAEDAGFDSVMISEHVVLGPDASDKGVMGNPRDYAMPGNQDPLMPWPHSLTLFSAIAAVTSRIRLVGAAVLAPLRHPLMLARELGTLDLLSEGRLVVQPSVSWSKDEYAALGVPFRERGRILDEQLEVMNLVFTQSPATHHGRYFDFEDIYLEPKAFRPEGPRMWFGGQKAHGAVVDRLARYGHGFHPLGRPTEEDLRVVREAMAAAGRDAADLEMVGGVRYRFPDDRSLADLGESMDSIPAQLDQGFTTFCIKPSMYIDDASGMENFCRDVMKRAEAMGR
ncbi:TIGR03619 family F420-dependent LLM class oxidoreductase [Pimelobacter simplex]|uniref:TIGR03619 family F420-dependent LLM class oxidoreductase n=1 Tax=Nocardioides simplex TaxID=2045 RepID=UPI00214FD879|nr:TIGR03619 family F420-dependent LLM class oxidoreductase [Pimelobacter simplex]UUW92452.1 TIGR03619 family F420-dependent LLM class oxidoreductase [Pimelobacter simplex]UUW96280.1 TIGR03619 family F420-dependent LLM class oxidoreductase [Pimelobacter simplex]